MKNLKELNVIELESQELKDINGGLILEAIGGVAAMLTIAYFIGYGVKRLECELSK
jgi:lactobin A/cerein 7B family class IIb bacteriocin